MRVLMLTYEMQGAGGSYVRSFSLARALSRLGHEMTIWCARSKQMGIPTATRSMIEGIEVVAFPGVLPDQLRHGGVDPLELVWRRCRVGRAHFDLVHGFGHRPTVSLTAELVRRRLAIPYLADWADLWNIEGLGCRRRGLLRTLLGRADHVWEPLVYTAADALTVISRDLAERAQALGVPPARIHLCPVGANIETIKPQNRDAMRARHGLPAGAPIVCHMGFNCYDGAFLGHAFVRLAAMAPDVILLLIGSDIPELDAVIDDAGLADRVVRTGTVPLSQLSEHLACADVMLLPNLDNPMNRSRYPNKVGDYLASGRPTVANATGDLGDLLATTQSGLLADQTPEAFAAATCSLLTDSELARQIGNQARRAAEIVISWQALAGKLAAFYKKMMEKR